LRSEERVKASGPWVDESYTFKKPAYTHSCMKNTIAALRKTKRARIIKHFDYPGRFPKLDASGKALYPKAAPGGHFEMRPIPPLVRVKPARFSQPWRWKVQLNSSPIFHERA